MNLADTTSPGVSPTGVLGDPTAATLSEGNRLFDSLVDDLTRLITRLTNPLTNPLNDRERNER